MSKVALITGITGQDGAYLAEYLLKKGYIVHGIKRRASLFNTDRIDHLYKDLHEADVKLFLHYGDLSDSTNIIRIIQEVQPDEIYNLGAMSHVKRRFVCSVWLKKQEYTKRLLLSYMVWCKKYLSRRQRLFTRVLPMP
eukprot:maker-scaffold1044_size67654-snap-gene-0.2 protein:Tk06766 transcript:maker-scaffold1044_size67654-snap-gene-0.2-mRNA-1 annotation:"nad dependent epimerase dehydratase family protein"